jgi:hypothetical protein
MYKTAAALIAALVIIWFIMNKMHTKKVEKGGCDMAV